MIAFSLPAPRCESFEFDIRPLTQKSPIAAGTRRQDKCFSFTLAPGPGGVDTEEGQVFFSCNAPMGGSLLPARLIGPAEDGPVLRGLAAIDADAADCHFLTQHRRLI